MKNSFHFVGTLPASKSIFNRALIISSFSENPIQIIGNAQSNDIDHMKVGLKNLKSNLQIECGEAGTVLRFLAFRCSRETGLFKLTGSKRLFQRPQKELEQILLQLGVNAYLNENELEIRSKGWKLMGDGIYIPSEKSSQFATGLLLNSWNLPHPMFLQLSEKIVSEPYLKMTIEILKTFGMDIQKNGNEIFIPKNQKIQLDHFNVEMDVSSAFVIAAMAAINGSANIENYPQSFLQPDAEFVQILKKMGIPISLNGNRLNVQKTENILPIEINLMGCPDLFPVLAILCGFSSGKSSLRGATQLVHKESNRILKVSELLTKLGVRNEIFDDGLNIYGKKDFNLEAPINYDTDQDHRLAMAAAVAMQFGFKINLSHPDVVAKSFKNFWSMSPNIHL